MFFFINSLFLYSMLIVGKLLWLMGSHRLFKEGFFIFFKRCSKPLDCLREKPANYLCFKSNCYYQGILFLLKIHQRCRPRWIMTCYFVFYILDSSCSSKFHFKSNQSFLLVYEAVKTTTDDQVGWRGYMGRVIWVWVFYVGRCVLREWVVGGGELDGYFGEQGLPLGIQEFLERFHRGDVDYLSR